VNPTTPYPSDSAISRRRVLLATTAALASIAQAPAPPPRIIAVFGDSQAEGLAVALRRVARQTPGIKVQNHTKAGSAISQPENYDWPAAMRAYEPDAQVDTAVLMFGGNDRLPMRPSPGVVIPFRSETWNQTYRSRTADMLHSLSDKHLRIFWVGNPVCRDAKYSQDMDYLNAIYRDELAGTDATFVDIQALVADADGHYAPYGKTLDGTTARLRLDDGIHFTPSGYDIIATRVMQAVLASGTDAK
jgi:hypothetical protein